MDHTVRTEYNTRDADGVLILNRGELGGGTAYAVEIAKHLNRPVILVDVEAPPHIGEIIDWLEQHHIGVLHIGGPRESSRPGIYDEAHALLMGVFRVYLQRQG